MGDERFRTSEHVHANASAVSNILLSHARDVSELTARCELVLLAMERI